MGVARRSVLALPANWVTFARAVLSVGIGSGVVRGLCRDGGTSRRDPPRLMLPAATVALALDAVDGWVARHLDSASAFGARFDGEVDALLILALSVQASRTHGSWVLPAGFARYAFWVAGRRAPWMRRPLPPRYWRKVATATEGIALAGALSRVVPPALARAGLLAGTALIAESFGRDVWWLWRRRALPPVLPTRAVRVRALRVAGNGAAVERP